MIPLRICIIFLLLAASGCRRNAGDPRIDTAQALVEQHPDSALLLLRRIDTARLSEADKARRRVLLSQGYSLMRVDIASDSLIGPAAVWYERHGSDAERARAWAYYGAVHANADRLDKAVEGYTTALRYADKVRGDKPIDRLRAAIYHNLGVLFDGQQYLMQAEEYFDRAATLYGELGEAESRLFSVLMKSMVLFEQHRYDEAIALLESIREEAARSENPELRVFVETYLIHYQIYAESRPAEKLLDDRNRIDRRAIDSLMRRNGRTLNDTAPLMMYNALCAILFYNTSQIDSAAIYLHRSLGMVDKYTSGVAGLLEIAAEIALKQGHTDSAYYYQQRYGSVLDSIYRAEQPVQVAELERRYRMQYETDLLRARHRYQTWIVLLACLLLAAGTVGAIAGYRRKLRRRDEQLSEYLALVDSYRESHDSLTSRLDATDEREAAVKRVLEGRMAVIRDIAATCYTYGEGQRLSAKMKELSLDPAMLSDVVRMADLYNDSAVTRLKEQLPGWTARNYDFAALVIAGFSPQEISVLLDMSLNGVYTCKSKLKRRIAASDIPDRERLLAFFE